MMDYKEMKVYVEEGANIPVRAHVTDAGLDLYATETKTLYGWSSKDFGTGVHIKLPPNTYGRIEPKSGLNFKHNIFCFGTIDEGYTGEIRVKLYNNGFKWYTIHKGDKIAQLTVVPCYYVECKTVSADEIIGTERGDNGFGSTGR